VPPEVYDDLREDATESMDGLMSKIVSATLALAALFSAPAFAADLQKGKTIYEQRCATCHGPQGAGDGPLAVSLPADQKPRNFQEGKMKFATDDAKFKELIKKGGGGVGLSMLMPPQPDLSDDDIDGLALFVHSLKK
jgi:mono/diheme cytochrome c family protein